MRWATVCQTEATALATSSKISHVRSFPSKIKKMWKITTILCTEPYHIPHIDSIYDEMAGQEGIHLIRAAVHPVPAARQDLGWSELYEDSPYLQPWRRRKDYWAYYKALVTADVVVMPAAGWMTVDNLIRRMTGKLMVAWCEPFLGDPRLASRSVWRWRLRRAVYALFDSPRYNLLAVGHNVEKEYYHLGLRRMRAWQFAYAVKPVRYLPEGMFSRTTGPVRILYVGSLFPHKGLDVLLDALGMLSVANRDWQLTVVGEGPMHEELIQLAEKLGISGKVVFRGSVLMHEVAHAYGEADLLVLPSRYDGWGAVLNEAMEYGLAVVASSTVGAAQQLIDPGRNGFIFRTGDPADLASCLGKIVGCQSILSEMRRASRERIRVFRPAETGRRLVMLCRGLVGHAPMPEFADGPCIRLPMNG